MLRLMKKGLRSLIGMLRLGQRLESWLDRTRELVHYERHAPLGLPWAQRLWAIRNGFYSNRVVMYGLTRENLANYVPDRYFEALHPINGRFSQLIDDKFQLLFTLKDFPEYVPKTYYLVIDGLLFGLADGLEGCQRYTPGPILELLHQGRRLVLKPEYGSGGEGVRLVECASGLWRLDGRPCSESDVVEILRGLRMHVICECVEQHPYARRFFPHATNTIRLITLRDDDTLQPFLVAAFHRVGTRQSQPVDNLAGGGLFGRIDLMTGELGRFTRYPASRSLDWFTHHPDTAEPLAGVVIPRWRDIAEQILAVSRKLSFLTLMGYDVVVTEDGLKILEINSLPTLLPQTFQPYMSLPPLAMFFRRRIPKLRRCSP